MLDRRQLLGGLASLVGIPAVKDATTVTPEAGLLVLTIRDGYDATGIRQIREVVANRLREAGCGHVPFVLLAGIDAQVVPKTDKE